MATEVAWPLTSTEQLKKVWDDFMAMDKRALRMVGWVTAIGATTGTARKWRVVSVSRLMACGSAMASDLANYAGVMNFVSHVT